ncbi:MAG: hypothetical protein GFH27_549279n236 [Chloroflexi bacterium AL-W]|nr:hypothetical protein [Chloroflexi bacterium AL-N1]NOK65202.1 hypothetical protein [Chloroflexi bacterium AL-N10]NOK72533.1 hypothetical protein [Chloroflexi bacterium AL-N5]NOK79381.1 hypothetical protein [Chloroflexi bacterium AL-W]NOK87297.1 hypothetical protein [Chloroflexi bacterium AL-N15]
MSEDIAQLLYDGAIAVTEGRKTDAQGLLLQVIEMDERNEHAWLWLSGAMDDPADQQIALENVLAINPNNQAAHDGLAWLAQQQAPATPLVPIESLSQGQAISPEQFTGPWIPPEALGEDDVIELTCWKCSAALYNVAQFCWQCHAPVHCCNNCKFLPDPRCKELQDLSNALAQAAVNRCSWWRPS